MKKHRRFSAATAIQLLALLILLGLGKKEKEPSD